MTHDEITQSMCRASMWQGFAEKIEGAEKTSDTTTQNCTECGHETDCIEGLCLDCRLQNEENERINREEEKAEERRLSRHFQRSQNE